MATRGRPPGPRRGPIADVEVDEPPVEAPSRRSPLIRIDPETGDEEIMGTPDKPDHPLMHSLLQRTRQVKKDAQRPRAYNHPPLWYIKPDGDIVRLQGDPGNRAYYVDKGYDVLRPEEVELYLRELRPEIIREQRRRAAAITTMRRIATKHPGVELAGDLDITPTEELEAMLNSLRTQAGGAVAVVQGRFREENDRDVEAAGTDAGSIDELRGKMARGAAQTADAR